MNLPSRAPLGARLLDRGIAAALPATAARSRPPLRERCVSPRLHFSAESSGRARPGARLASLG